jgi:hypothetical protein
MKLGEQVLKILDKKYEPSKMIEVTFKRYDMAFKTDDDGRPILLFIGEKDITGKINGEKFARRLVTDPQGVVIKDHWDNKGKATT